MSGSGTRDFRIGDIVKQGDTYGQISGGSKGSWTVRSYTDKGVLGTATTGVADADLVAAGYAKFMSKSGVDRVVEIAWNCIIYSMVQKFRSNPTFGPRFYSFMTSEAAYELFLKFFIENMIPMLRPEAIKMADSGWMPAQGDFHDAVKTIPIVFIQQCVLKLVYKRKFFGHLMKNLIDAFIAIVAGNYTGRGLSSALAGVTGGTPDVYRW